MEKLLFFLGVVAVVAADNTRVEFKLYNYTSSGTLHNGDKCDIGTHCDPRLKGYVDTEKPDAPWPGPLPMEKWALIYEGLDIANTARLNKIVSRDFCASPYKKSNLRVQVDEIDPTRVDKMEQFMCLSGRDVARSERSAEWSDPKSCDAHYFPRKNKLLYSWRAYPISSSACGKTL
ncbi:uncharacterized protein LOC129587508 [Paramacrobiotus metropolitanus]|uniref:uncharacterized protein LOC129587508 n=1 Tax=Paramacrobiotus metropolitanus TaxID=2943436 RepID=UPI0024457CCF|nr:uncharacterized protein LOC129587508 [Paramacrobiotus metropolitanus]